MYFSLYYMALQIHEIKTWLVLPNTDIENWLNVCEYKFLVLLIKLYKRGFIGHRGLLILPGFFSLPLESVWTILVGEEVSLERSPAFMETLAKFAANYEIDWNLVQVTISQLNLKFISHDILNLDFGWCQHKFENT